MNYSLTMWFALMTIVFAVTAQSSHCKKEKQCLGQTCGKPNFIILLADDLGYGDLACYGHPIQEFGGIDRMASEGLRFTSFYSADSMCSPSRAGLLTGQLPIRVGITGGRRVFLTKDTGGLPKNVITLPEALKTLGYATGMVGKWHLGINAKNYSDGEHLPSRHGFDFVGFNLPYTNVWNCDESGAFSSRNPNVEECFLYRGDKIVQQPVHLESLTTKLVEDFKIFIEENADRPFFFYFSFPHVHTHLFADEQFKGSSKRGIFGDNLNEMHSAVDEVLNFLKSECLDSKTLVLFLSDHGPHRELCELGGVTGGLSGGKKSSFEGGFRIPVVARWPGVIPEGSVSQTTLSALDLFPTFFKLAGGANLPDELDGIDVSSYLLGKTTDTTESVQDRLIYFYCNQSLMAIRYKNLKVHFATPVLSLDADPYIQCPEGMPLRDMYAITSCIDGELILHDPPLVFDLDKDPFENYVLNVEKYREKLEVIQRKIEEHKLSLKPVEAQLGKFNPKVIPCCNFPSCHCNYPE